MVVSEAGCRLAFFTRWSPDWCWVWPGAQMQHDARHVQDVEYRWIQTKYDWQGIFYMCVCMCGQQVGTICATDKYNKCYIVYYKGDLTPMGLFASQFWIGTMQRFFLWRKQMAYLIHCGNIKQVSRPSTFSQCWFSKDEDPFVPRQQQEIKRPESLEKYLIFPTCFQPLRQFGRDWGPAFVQKCRRRLLGKVLNETTKTQRTTFDICNSSVIPTYGPPQPHYMAFIGLPTWFFSHARKAAESAQRSREAMQQMSACKCTWRFDAAFDCPCFPWF